MVYQRKIVKIRYERKNDVAELSNISYQYSSNDSCLSSLIEVNSNKLIFNNAKFEKKVVKKVDIENRLKGSSFSKKMTQTGYFVKSCDY